MVQAAFCYQLFLGHPVHGRDNRNDKQVDLMVEIFKKLVEFCLSPENLCDALLLKHCIPILAHANQPDYDFV